jgi:hypothetical protein
MKYVLRWRRRNGRERPVVENATGDALRWQHGFDTKREAIQQSLKEARRSLERAKKAVAANEQYITDLEALLAKEPVQ